MIAQLGESIGDEKRYEIDFAPGHGTNAAFISDGHFLIIGTNEIALIEPSGSKKVLCRDLINAHGLASQPGSRFIIASHSVKLSELDIAKGEVTRIARLKLNSSSSELVESTKVGGYLFFHYSKTNNKSAGILIHWQYKY